MSDDTFGEDPFAAGASSPLRRSSSPELDEKARILEERRKQFEVVANLFLSIWKHIYQVPPFVSDEAIQELYKEYLKLAPHLGVSLNGLPQLRECCGNKRVTPELLQDPSKALLGTAALPAPAEELAWWPGDIIRRITRFFGAAYCEKCDQRRRWINSWFGKRY